MAAVWLTWQFYSFILLSHDCQGFIDIEWWFQCMYWQLGYVLICQVKEKKKVVLKMFLWRRAKAQQEIKNWLVEGL